MNTFNLKSVKIMDLLLHFQIYFTQEPLIPVKKNEGLITLSALRHIYIFY